MAVWWIVMKLKNGYRFPYFQAYRIRVGAIRAPPFHRSYLERKTNISRILSSNSYQWCYFSVVFLRWRSEQDWLNLRWVAMYISCWSSTPIQYRKSHFYMFTLLKGISYISGVFVIYGIKWKSAEYHEHPIIHLVLAVFWCKTLSCLGLV